MGISPFYSNATFYFGDPYGNRTHDLALRGPRLNRLTKGPLKLSLYLYHFFYFSSTVFAKNSLLATGVLEHFFSFFEITLIPVAYCYYSFILNKNFTIPLKAFGTFFTTIVILCTSLLTSKPYKAYCNYSKPNYN